MSIDVHAVVLDTDVFSQLYVNKRRDAQVTILRESLLGWRVVIAFQSRAEVLAGARIDDWGARRSGELRKQLDATPTIPPDERVIDAYVRLTADSRAAGHPLEAKVHTGDRGVAACAIAHGLPLMSLDGIFRNAPGLTTFSTTDPTAAEDVPS